MWRQAALNRYQHCRASPVCVGALGVWGDKHWGRKKGKANLNLPVLRNVLVVLHKREETRGKGMQQKERAGIGWVFVPAAVWTTWMFSFIFSTQLVGSQRGTVSSWRLRKRKADKNGFIGCIFWIWGVLTFCTKEQNLQAENIQGPTLKTHKYYYEFFLF